MGSRYSTIELLPLGVAIIAPRLIVNADDFGLTRGVNRAIAELHAAGVVTSTTLMATGAAFADAVAIAHAHPSLGVGCHVVLTDGLPVSPPASIPTLLGDDGRSFRPSLQAFLIAVLRGRVRADELQLEATAQIRTLQQAGLSVTHLDTHKHTHVLPAVARALLAAAEATGVRALRNPFEDPWSLRLGYGRPFRLLAVTLTRLLRHRFLSLPALRNGHVRTTRGTIGISATGRLNEPMLRQILASLPAGTWELVCHPGYDDQDLDCIQTRLRSTREVERKALLSALARNLPQSFAQRPASRKDPISPELIGYGDLLKLDPLG